MTYLVTIYILVINFLYSIIQSKKVVLYSTTFFMILFFGGIYNCADESNYQSLYGYVNYNNNLISYFYTTSTFGFFFLVFLANKIGLTYQLFRTLIGIFALLIIQKTALEYTKKYSLVFLLYFIYPFMLNVIQIRNFLAASIIIYSLQFLVQSSIRGNVKYIIGIFIAISIHYMSVFFLPFIFVKRFSIRQLIITTIIIVPILVGLTSTPIIPNLIQNIISDELMLKVNIYLQRVNWGFLLVWARQLTIFSLTYFCYLKVKNSELDDNWKALNSIIIKLNIYLIIVCFPMVMFNGSFYRLTRDLLFLNYIIISQVLYLSPKKGIIYSIFAIFLCLIYLGLDILTELNVNGVLIPFFQSNSYLSF